MLSLLGVAKGPCEKGADRKHCQAELGKEDVWLPLVTQSFKHVGFLQLGPSHLKPKIQSQLDKSVKPGLWKSQAGGGHAGGNMLELNISPSWTQLWPMSQATRLR